MFYLLGTKKDVDILLTLEVELSSFSVGIENESRYFEHNTKYLGSEILN